MKTNQPTRGDDTGSTLRALTEPYAFALLQWPALIGVLVIDGEGSGAIAVQVVLGIVIALTAIGAYGGGRGIGFGNAMLACGGCVAAAWWVWPTAWSLAWLAALALLLLAAQNLRLRGAAQRGHRDRMAGQQAG